MTDLQAIFDSIWVAFLPILQPIISEIISAIMALVLSGLFQ